MTDINLTIRVLTDGNIAKEQWDGTGVAGVLVKSVEEKRYTLCCAYPSNKPDVGVSKDGHIDFASADAVEEAAFNYMVKCRSVGAWHAAGTDGAGTVVESYIYRGPDWEIAAGDGSEHVIKAGDWMLGVRWDEPTWALIKAGHIGGVSPQGTAQRRAADASTIAGLRS